MQIKYAINIFIINDNYSFNSIDRKNERVSMRANFSILERLSDVGSDLKLSPSTLASFEVIYIINCNKNSRYIFKLYFSNLFGEKLSSIDEVSTYRRKIEKSLFSIVKESSENSMDNSFLNNENNEEEKNNEIKNGNLNLDII